MKPEVKKFIEEMLAVLRRQFFEKWPEKLFWTQRSMLIRGITEPAAYMHKRGAKLPIAAYRKILDTVISTIKREGCGDYRRLSAYFLKCVQNHMDHHGDEYYESAKRLDGRTTSPRHVSAALNRVLKTVKPGQDRSTEILAEAHRAIRSPGGRISKKKQVPEPDLFTNAAPRVHKP